MSRGPAMRGRSILIAIIAIIAGASFGSATSTSAAPPSPSPSQIIGQLEIAGIEGESQRVGFKGAVEIRSFDFAASKSGAKDPRYRKFQVAAAIDSAAVGLLDRLSLGTAIPTVKLSLTRAIADETAVYKTFTLTKVKVVTLREYASGQDSDLPMIEVAFEYKRIAVEYRGQNPDGSSTAPLGFCWNLANASEC